MTPKPTVQVVVCNPWDSYMKQLELESDEQHVLALKEQAREEAVYEQEELLRLEAEMDTARAATDPHWPPPELDNFEEADCCLPHVDPDDVVDEGSSLEERLVQCELEAVIELALPCLSEREAFVLNRRLGREGIAPMTLKAIGEMTGVGKETVRQVEGRALRKLRSYMHLSKRFRYPGGCTCLLCVSNQQVVDRYRYLWR